MSTLSIKKEHSKKVIVFGGLGNIPVGEHNQENLEKLALIARQSNDQSIIELFDGELPALKDLQARATKVAKANPEKEEIGAQPNLNPNTSVTTKP